jgi:hypothetical protein
VNRFEHQVVAAMEALDVDADGRIRWFDEPVGSKPTPGGDPPLTLLTTLLYQHFYAPGFAEPARDRVAAVASPRDRFEFERALERSAPFAVVEESGWAGIGRKGGRVHVRRDGVVFATTARGDGRRTAGESPTPRRLTVRVPSVRVGWSPGYFMFHGQRAGTRPPARPARFYWNTTASQAPRLVKALGASLSRAGFGFTIKALADPRAYDRCDAVVVISDRRAIALVMALAERLAASGDWKRSDLTPAFTLPLLAGLGYADAPKGGESFGQNRCALVAGAIVKSHRQGDRGMAARLDRVREAFRAHDTTLEAPYGSRPRVRSSKRRGALARGVRRGGIDAMEIANSISRELCTRAVEWGDACTWVEPRLEVPASSLRAGSVASRPLGPDLYGGTAGVAFFLGHWAAATGNRRARRVAASALRHALTSAERAERGGGFYEGWAGVAWCAAHVGRLLGEEEIAVAARRLARKRAVESDGSWDLLGGEAGTLLALLLLHEQLHDKVLLERATALGERLLAAAPSRDGERSWPSPGGGPANLTGLSHGTAGIAHALVELHRASGEARFRTAAEQAMAYERRLFNRDLSNWPDLRGAGAARSAREPRVMTAWCHGAGGIGLARLHAWEALQDQEAAAETRAALVSVRRVLSEDAVAGIEDLSLCHGIAGLSNLIAEARDAGVEPDANDTGLLQNVLERWSRLRRDATQLPRLRQAPGLFLGLAGIGYAAARIAGIPAFPILLPRLTMTPSPGRNR